MRWSSARKTYFPLYLGDGRLVLLKKSQPNDRKRQDLMEELIHLKKGGGRVTVAITSAKPV